MIAPLPELELNSGWCQTAATHARGFASRSEASHCICAVSAAHPPMAEQFEIKNDLAKLATASAQASATSYLNAGRGNPNWIATESP